MSEPSSEAAPKASATSEGRGNAAREASAVSDDRRGPRPGPRPRLAFVAATGGFLALALGTFGVGTYVWGVVDVLDQPDQSWFFWGSPFLLWGLGLWVVGWVLVLWGRSLSRP